jgi:hypothetical protein
MTNLKILATISDKARVAVVLDLLSGAIKEIPSRPSFHDTTIKERLACRSFGITWCEEELFIVNNRKLLVFNNHLEYVRTEATPLQVNMHQLSYHAKRVWGVSPATNSLIGIVPGSRMSFREEPDPRDFYPPFDLAGGNANGFEEAPLELDLIEGKLGLYQPRYGAENDLYHFNSLIWSGEYLFIAAHCFLQPSFILRFHTTSLRVDTVREEAGFSIHGLAMDGDDLFWISTNTSEIRSNHGAAFPIFRDGYARGLAMTRDYFVVAISEILPREKRGGGDSWIQVLERQSGDVVAEYHLRDTGNINDLRLLDEYDYAHGMKPFYEKSGNSFMGVNCLHKGASINTIAWS